MAVDIVTIETSDLGDRSYLVVDGTVAAVVDPQRDIDRVLAVADRLGVAVTHVFETHIHNDYVTGGLELARRTGAQYVLAAADEVRFDRTPIQPGESLTVGSFTVEAISTPGHTPNHLSYAVEQAGDPVAVFTGGSLLYGAVGRTDLISADLTVPLAHEQYRSAHRIADALPPPTEVMPTHGFGSFCSSDRSARYDRGTLADEAGRNPALTESDEDAFVRRLVAGYTAFPSYYAHMGPVNRAGPAPLDLSPPPRVDIGALPQRAADGAWVVDVRPRRHFAASHVRESVNIEGGDFFPTYLGWVVPWGTPVVLVADARHEIEQAQRSMARIGLDRPTGAAVLDADDLDGDARSYRVADFADLAAEMGAPTDGEAVRVLDVRRDDEWEQGHVPGAVHIHLPELAGRVDEVPEGEVWVHCASGYRAAVAASILEGAGRTPVLVDDNWDDAEPNGVPVVRD